MAAYTNPLSFIGEHYCSDGEDDIAPGPVSTMSVTPGPVVTKHTRNLARKTSATPPFPEEDYIKLPALEVVPPPASQKYEGVDLRDVLNKIRKDTVSSTLNFNPTPGVQEFRRTPVPGQGWSRAGKGGQAGPHVLYWHQPTLHGSARPQHRDSNPLSTVYTSTDAREPGVGLELNMKDAVSEQQRYVSPRSSNGRYYENEKAVDQKDSDASHPVLKKIKPYVPQDRNRRIAYIFVNNQDVKDSSPSNTNRYNAKELRKYIVRGLDDYETINGFVVAGYIPNNVKMLWEGLHFGIKCYINKQTIDMEYGFTKSIADVIFASKYYKNPQTIVLCITRDAAGRDTMLDLIKKAYNDGWKIIIWTWATRIDYQIKLFCMRHASIQLNYLDTEQNIFYQERK